MSAVRSGLLAALLVVFAHSDGFAQGYIDSHYESFWYQRPYRNDYHGYWRDLGYGFSNRQPYGVYYHSRSHREVVPYAWPVYAVPYGPQRRW